MPDIMTLFLLAFAVSLDSFTVGFTYGMRKVGLSYRVIFIIAGVSALTFFVAMLIGKTIAVFLSPHLTEVIGGSILILIGFWVIYQFFKSNKTTQSNEQLTPYIFKLEIKSLGIVIQILKKPMSADIDRSGSINGIEALLLGIALSLDAFGAGIGAAMFGFTPFHTALIIAFMSSFFLWVGLKSGYWLSYWRWLDRLSFLPGVLLIVLGVMKMT
ncbi:sporulation membrane protein YtaF [Pontibacillus yanchengensis]|uniref:Sporulation membrane protein YtaF n=2 Tax=Pontibacillus yanchengensis TaxID=462910 RepID=A0ACC7VEQ0_9BACI|nr:sporulation membrane protein YtaF [Pontibacillus yanchengensis]MYL34154.1 sporulation membrane protein YtaF [Pontibacillus yanchengensis]MYL53247.1 sporulation membrane protein YtaF [Pontibacillus yanchengensis]